MFTSWTLLKNILLSFIGIFFSISASAQSWQSLNDSVFYFFATRDFDRGLVVGEKAVRAAKTEFGELHKSYASSINSLAAMYANLGQNEKAEPLYLRSIEIRKIVLGENDLDYAASLNDLAGIYGSMNQFKKAEPLYILAIDVRKKILGEINQDYALSLSGLAWIYRNLGLYEKAEPLYLRCTEINKALFGEAHPDYATSLNNLAWLYEMTEKYKQSEMLMNQAMEIRKQVLGEWHADYAMILNSLGSLYSRMGQYKKAELLTLHAMEIRKKLTGEMHLDYAYSLAQLAIIYKLMGQYQKAEPLMIQAKETRKYFVGEKDPIYAESLFQLALLYELMGKYKKAEPLYLHLMEIIKSTYGEEHSYYASYLTGQAGLYQGMGDFKKAEPLYIQATDILRKTLGETHSEYIASLNNLGVIYQAMGYNQKAEFIYIQTKGITKRVSGETNPQYATILSNLGIVYENTGQYEKAELLYLQALNIRKKVFGDAHPEYALTLINLAWLYLRKGHYEKAEPLNLQALEITKTSSEENPTYYSLSLNNAAVLYRMLGQYKKAETLYIKSREVQKNIVGEKHPDYAISLHNLGELYLTMGDYKKAEPYFLKSNEIWQTTLGETHPLYASSLVELASVYKNIGQFDKAETLYLHAKEIRKNVLGESHPKYAESLGELGTLYSILNQNKKAEQLYLQSNEIRKMALGKSHPDYAAGLFNMAELYSNTKQFEKAENLVVWVNDIDIQNLKRSFSILSEKEKGDYLANNNSRIEFSNSLQYHYKKSSAPATINNFNLQLFFKSLSLTSTRNVLATIEKNKDENVQSIYKEWQLNKSLLAKQYSLPVSGRFQTLDSIEGKTEALEKELTRKSTEFSNQQKAINISISDLQQNLQANEVAIEFVRFNIYDKNRTDSTMYAAYILRKNDSVPVFVPLCEEKQLGKYFSSTTGSSNIKAIYRSDPIDENDKPSISGDSLYSLVWKPLTPFLKGIKKINYSPAGLFHKIAFHALPTGDSSLLMDRYDLNQYMSTRQLAIMEERTVNNASIALFGNCLFSMDSTTIVKNIPAKENANTLITASKERGDHTAGWKQLEGTAKEITSINSLFDQNKRTTNSYTQENATEEQFKSLSGHSPTILHLATHGFFLPDPEKKKQEGLESDNRNAFTLADDPLLRSGIVLSGANRVWSGQSAIAGREDGIVTAYEIAQMDLSKTDLVVLSACETALGDIKGNEGVFGLQRAFKLAGVKNMLLSLWKVPDTETAELMKLFYSYYLQGKTARESFTAAQKDMRKKYMPFYWAAFVLIE